MPVDNRTPQEKILDKINKKKETRNKKEEIIRILYGQEGVDLANAEFELLKKEVEKYTDTIITDNPEAKPVIDATSIKVTFENCLLIFKWWLQASNTLEGSHLDVVIKKKNADGTDISNYNDVLAQNYCFDITLDFQKGWSTSRKTFFNTSESLVEKWFNNFIDYVKV